MEKAFRKLEALCDIRSGGTPRRGTVGFYSGEIPWAKIADLESPDGIVRTTEESITDAGLEMIGGRLFPSGTLLLAMYGSVGKLATAGVELATNQAILGIQVKSPDVLDARYLERWLESIQEILVHRARGVTQKNLSAKIVRNLEIPLPPLEEQKRIAAILDKADAIRRKRQQAIALTEDLLRSTFLEMFGDPVLNPKGWPIEPLESVIDTVEAGWSARGEARRREGDEWGVLKVSAVTSGHFKATEHKAVTLEQAQSRDLVIPKRGDLLFSRANTRELVAAVCLVEEDSEREFLPDKLWRIATRPADATREYLRFLIGDPGFRHRLTRTATGTSGSMLNISKPKLLDCVAPKPPIDLQKQFATCVWRTIGLRSKCVSAQGTSNNLFGSLSQRAFRGEL